MFYLLVRDLTVGVSIADAFPEDFTHPGSLL